MEKVTLPIKRRELWERVLLDEPTKEIYRSHFSEEERLHTCADTYVSCTPHSSWEEFVGELYWHDEVAAAREAKALQNKSERVIMCGAGISEHV